MKIKFKKWISSFLALVMVVTMFIGMPQMAYAAQQTIDITTLSSWNGITNYLAGPSSVANGGYDLVKFWVANDADYLYVRWDIQLWGNQTDLQSTYLNVVLSSSTNGSTADAAAILSFDSHSAATASLQNLGTNASVDLDAANNVRLFNIGAQDNLVSVVARINFSAFNTIGVGASFNAASAFPLWAQDNASQSPTSNIKDRIPATGYFSYDAANGSATIVGFTASDAKEILTYTLPNGVTSIDSSAGTISVTLPAGTNLTNLISTFTTSDNVKAVAVNGTNQASGTTTNDFTNSVTYVVTAEDGTTKDWVVTVNLQEPTYDVDYTISKVVDNTSDSGLRNPQGIAFDSDGNLYISASGNNIIFKVDVDGEISRLIDSTAIEDFYGSETQEADYYDPTGIAVDGQGNVYIVDSSNSVILKADLAGGNISKFVDSGLDEPSDVAVDSSGNVYVSDTYNYRIIKMSADGQSIVSTPIDCNRLCGITVDADGNVYVSDSGDSVVYKITYDSEGEIVDVVAGNGYAGYSGDGGQATDAELNSPADVAVDSDGNLYIMDSGNFVIRVVDAETQEIYTIAGTGQCGHSGDDGPALSADLSLSDCGIEVDGNGNVYFSNKYYYDVNDNLVDDHVIRKLTPQQQSTPDAPDVSADDTNDKIIGADETMEYSTDGGMIWIDYDLDNEPTFPGDQTVKVRVKETESTPAGDSTTLTFTKEGTFTIDGTVMDDADPAQNVSGASVKVMQGNTQFGTGTTDANGYFIITGVPNGTYNLVVTKGTQLVTLCATVKDGNYNCQQIVLPTGNKNSRLNVTGTGTPSVVVDGLNDLFDDSQTYVSADQTVVDNGGTVLIKLTVEKKEAEDVEGSSDLQSLAGSQTIAMYLDMTLLKTVTDALNNSTDTTLSTVGSLLKIIVPYDLSGKSNVTIYRYHGNKAEKMTNLGIEYLNTTPSTEGYVLDSDNNQIIIWAKNFSTYAIAYGTSSSAGGSSGSSSSTNSYSIKVSKDITGGGISPKGTVSVTKGDSKTFTIKPEDGYVISDVLVDGKSVGAVSSYTFSNITASHTITAVFVRDSGLPYYYNDNGVKVFIGFASDDSGTMRYIAPTGETVLFQDNPKSFTDIASHWGKSYIDFVSEREIFVGAGEDIFAPDTGMTRAMLATVIGRLYERSYGTLTATSTHAFTDCDYSSWYGSYINWCAENGIIKGVGGSKFEPERQVTRQEMAAMLYRFAEFMKESTAVSSEKTLSYSDASDIASWASDAALYCQETEIMTGRDANDFAPEQTATRAEVATILMRFIQLVVSN